MGVASLRLGDGSGETWGPAVDRLLADVGAGDTFGSDWARQQQARLFAVDRKCRRWARTTVLLTATASTTWPQSDDHIPPVIHLRRGILASRDARQKALSRVLRGISWRAIRTYGVDNTGHLHTHTGVYVGSDADESAFERWVRAHTNNSPLADESAHGSGAIEVRDVTDGDQGLAAYVMRNCPGLDTRDDRRHGLASAPTPQQRGAVVVDRAGVAPLTFGHT
jgi:hypothetical protein